jgi:nucleoside phosphorylase
MLLITIAHKAEAQAFIKRKHNIPVEFYFTGIYRHEDEILLLTGSKMETVMDRIRQVLIYYGKNITNILNMGIAGALHDSLQLNQIYGIGNIYFENSSEIYQSANPRPQIDCISVTQAVVDNNRAKKLARTALCVDMELWGMAKVAQENNISLRSYKLISDYAGSETDLLKIKNNAPIFSKHLFDFYKKLPWSN